MQTTHDSTGKSVASAVIFLGVLAATSAQAIDRKAQAGEAARAAQSFVSRPNPYAAGSAQNIAFEQQRAATSQTLHQLKGAAAGSRSTEVSGQRGAKYAAAATTGALTQPLQVQRQEALPLQRTALGGDDKSGQASYLMEIALMAQQNTTATSDALAASRQQFADVSTAINSNSQDVIADLVKTVQAQIALKQQQEQAIRIAAAKAAAPKKLKVFELLKLAGRKSTGTAGGGNGLNTIPSVFNGTTEIVGNLDKASEEFGRDNIAASVNRTR